MYGSNTAVQFRNGAIDADGERATAPKMRQHANGKRDGLCPHVEYYVFRHVSVAVKPHCGLCHRGCARDADAYALRAGTTGPWAPPGQVKVMNMPALINNAKCMCAWGGVILVNNPSGSMTTQGK